MTSHLQQLLDAAIAQQVAPLGRAIEDALGGLDDEQAHVVADALQRAVIVGARVAFVEAVAQANEQLEGKGYTVDLVLALEAAPPPPQ